MWSWTGRRSGRLAEEVEMLRRKVDAVLYDQEDIKSRLQKVLWRIGKLGAGAAAQEAPGTAPSTDNAIAPSVTSTDPVSARILARRGRGRLPALQPAAPREDERD